MTPAPVLPPRHTLPRDIEIPALPGVGITWYDRGAKYWRLRARAAFMWALALLLIGLVDAGFFGAAHKSSPAIFAVLVALDVVVAVAAVGFAAVRTWQRWNVPALPGRRRPARLGAQLAMLGCAFAFLIFPGPLVALFLVSLLPQPLVERQARLWLAERLTV